MKPKKTKKSKSTKSSGLESAVNQGVNHRLAVTMASTNATSAVPTSKGKPQ